MMLVAYALFILTITASPRMPGTGFVGRVVTRLLYELHSRNILMSVDFYVIEFVGNILMFVPLGILAALLISRKAWWILLFLGTVFSGAIELYQATFLPGRVPEVRDIVSNTTGFLIGAVFSIVLRMLVSHRDSLVELDRQKAELLARTR